MNRAEQSIVLPPIPTSARQGREFARQTLAAWNLGELSDDVALGATELVTNAVRHAGTDIVLKLVLDGRVIVSVRDGEPALDHPLVGHMADPYATSGRGLHLVAAISTDWGVTTLDDGKEVWFALALPASGGQDADVFELDDRRHDEDTTRSDPGVAI
ncbi:MAG: ATP-binding protein [Jatrophihabitans sp.]|uniref:ATP-binding protein n=1 Tax=Jatrophihabitans sp. TaxID=1932789 RepID=UPI003F7FAB57